jgi:hypothetical protein
LKGTTDIFLPFWNKSFSLVSKISHTAVMNKLINLVKKKDSKKKLNKSMSDTLDRVKPTKAMVILDKTYTVNNIKPIEFLNDGVTEDTKDLIMSDPLLTYSSLDFNPHCCMICPQILREKTLCLSYTVMALRKNEK